MQLNRVRFSYWMALSGYFGLVIGIYVWHMWIKKTPAHQMSVMLIVQLGPLMFPLRGLLAGRVYTHAWAMYLAIFYFVLGVWYAGADEDMAFGMYTVASSMLFFAGTLFYTRYASRQGTDSAGKPPVNHT